MLKLAATLLAAAAATAAPPAKKTPPMSEILAAAPATAWRDLDQADLVYMDLPKGRVVIELANAFAPEHVANIKALIRAGFFDKAAIIRSQDNFVVQWGYPDGAPEPPLGEAKAKIGNAEFTRPAKGLAFTPLKNRDPFAPEVGVAGGMPAARDAKTGRAWAVHCYGVVAVARDNDPATGNGGSLYAAIGPARRLDRNLTVVGRVVQGMELLSPMPRGDGALGFYTKAEDRTPIRLRLGADLPAAEQLKLQALRADSPTFATVVEARRTRRDDFYADPPGGADICDTPLPVRPAP